MSEGATELSLPEERRPIVFDAKLDLPAPDVSESSPILLEILEDPSVKALLDPLKELSPWKYDHSLDTARMIEPVYEALDALRLPHVPVEVAVRAALLHDIGVADNPHIQHPEIVNAARPLTGPERDQMNTHAAEGARRVEDPTVAAIIRAHHDYDRFPSEPLTASSDPVKVSQQVFAAIDIRHAMQDEERPYLVNGIFSDEQVREELRKKVPHIQAMPQLVDRILQVGDAVLNTPVSQHITETVG